MINHSEGAAMPFIKGFTTHLKRSPRDMGSTIMTVPTANFRQQDTSLEQAMAATPEIRKNQFKIRLANMHDIQREASMLIQERYAQRGYGAQELSAAPNRLTIVAYEDMEAVGTLSVGFDSPAGLLCDDLYRTELDTLRASGRRACEFIKFAVASSASSTRTLAALFHVAFIYSHRIHGFDDVLIEVNPRHVRFYQRALGFKQIGAERTNRRVNAPAILLRGEFSYIGEQIMKFGGNPEARGKEKTIYPYGFGKREEQGILRRLEAMGAVRQ
jgi:hypothetical protein